MNIGKKLKENWRKIKMKDTDFSSCIFIKEQLCFLTYFDFCKNAAIIKMHFIKLPKDAKIFYKFYVYANIHMDEFHKNLVWNFLNTDDLQSYLELIENIKKRK